MTTPRIRILATGGTIAGSAGSTTERAYRPGQIAVGELLAAAAGLTLAAEFDGRDIAAILDDLVARTPGVIADIEANLPKGFPDHVAGPVLQGLERAARQLGGS